MNFAQFKSSEPAKAMFRKLGLSSILDDATSWKALRMLVVDFNRTGSFVERVRWCNGVASSGERILLHAICYVTDFAWLADDLSGGRAWRNMDRAYGEWRAAVAACIAAEV